jgi:hypothetical protein
MKRTSTGKHFVQNCAKRKDVRTLIDWTTHQLFRRHVSNSSHDHARIGIKASCWDVCLRLIAIQLRELRETKVENLYSSVVRDEDVVRFEIAVNDSFFMGCS